MFMVPTAAIRENLEKLRFFCFDLTLSWRVTRRAGHGTCIFQKPFSVISRRSLNILFAAE